MTWREHVGWVLIVLLMFLLTVMSALAVEDYVQVNESMVPFEQVFELNISLVENATVFLERTDSSVLLVSFENESFLENASIILEFFVELNQTFSENKSLVASFNLTSDVNNNTYEYDILVDFVYGGNDTFVKKTGFFVNVLNGNYVINITTNLLPKNGILGYTIAGKSGENLNISCNHDWVVCPNQSVFGSDNLTSFDVKYTIPISASLGVTSIPVSLVSGNISRTTSIIFEVSDPGLEILTYQFNESCFVGQTDGSFLVKEECLQAQEEYNIQRLSQILSLARAYRENFTCTPEILTEYIMSGDIEKNVLDDYNVCRKERDGVRDDLKSCLNQNNFLELNNTDLAYALLNNETECRNNLFTTKVRLDTEFKSLKKKHWTTYTVTFGTSIALILTTVGVFFWFKKRREEAWSG